MGNGAPPTPRARTPQTSAAIASPDNSPTIAPQAPLTRRGKGESRSVELARGAKRKAFLEALRHYPVIRYACDVAGLGRTTVADWMKEDAAFAAAVDVAKADGVERLEAEVFRRANGADVERPSDLLSIFTLKAHKPELYRERVDHRVTGAIQHVILVDLVAPSGQDPSVIEAEVIRQDTSPIQANYPSPLIHANYPSPKSDGKDTTANQDDDSPTHPPLAAGTVPYPEPMS